MSSTNWTLPRESREWVGPITVTVNKVATATFTVSVVPMGSRPAVFLLPDVLGGELGALVGPGSTWPLDPGVYGVWVKVAATGESPVLDNIGTIVVT